MPSHEHAVWALYDRLRTARLNRKYYGKRLSSLEQRLLAIDVTIAFTAPSSAAAGLWFWDTEIGSWVWQILAIIAAVTAVVKPLLHLTDRIKRMAGALSGYRMLEYDLMSIKLAVEQLQVYDASLAKRFAEALQRERDLIGLAPEHVEHQATKLSCQAEVNAELPPESFFVPSQTV